MIYRCENTYILLKPQHLLNAFCIFVFTYREFEIKLENRQLPVIEQLDINGGLLFKKAVCCDS